MCTAEHVIRVVSSSVNALFTFRSKSASLRLPFLVLSHYGTGCLALKELGNLPFHYTGAMCIVPWAE